MRSLFSKADQPAALKPGQQALDFKLPSTHARDIKLSELRGQPVIIAFYPKDNTAVCSSQMALYNEVLDMFQEYDAVLLGISVDDLKTHQDFSESLKLNFPLLSDADPRGEVARIYGGTPNLWLRLAHAKALPSYRIGEVLVVFRPSDVEEYICSHPLDGPASCRDGRRKGKKPGRPRKVTAGS